MPVLYIYICTHTTNNIWIDMCLNHLLLYILASSLLYILASSLQCLLKPWHDWQQTCFAGVFRYAELPHACGLNRYVIARNQHTTLFGENPISVSPFLCVPEQTDLFRARKLTQIQAIILFMSFQRLNFKGTCDVSWLVVWTPLKNISQLGWLFPIYGKIMNGYKWQPNHQPVRVDIEAK